MTRSYDAVVTGAGQAGARRGFDSLHPAPIISTTYYDLMAPAARYGKIQNEREL